MPASDSSFCRSNDTFAHTPKEISQSQCAIESRDAKVKREDPITESEPKYYETRRTLKRRDEPIRIIPRRTIVAIKTVTMPS